MTTSRELIPGSAEAIRHLVEAVPAPGWDRPSPAQGWTARDVLGHLTSEQLWAPHLLRGETLEEVGDRYDGDVLGDDPVGAFTAALERSVAAFASTEVESVHTSAGEIPLKVYAQQMQLDLVIHGWDIARATSTRFEPLPDGVDAALRYLRAQVGPEGTPGIFAPPVDTDSARRIDQLVALAGRDPNWTPQA